MKKRLLSVLLLLSLLLASCGTQGASAILYNKLHTDVSVTLYAGGTDRPASALIAECEAFLDRAEQCLSRTDSQAELARLNAAAQETVALSPMLAQMLSLSLACAAETGGLFDPTAGILTALYDIGGSSPLPDDAAISQALAHVGYARVSLSSGSVTRPCGTVLDFGAIAKGYLAEQLVARLTEAGVPGGVLSLGGNVAVFGEKADGSDFRVAVRSPFENGGTVGVLQLRGTCYVSTSGAYERYRVDENGKRYHHIFDTQSGRPAESDLASVTVVAADGARADAWSTALFIAGYENALQLWQQSSGAFEMLLVRADGEIYTTPGLAFTPV